MIDNPGKLSSPTTPNPDINSIIVMGHSAGAVHAGTLLLEPEVLPADSPLRNKIKAVVLMAGVYYWDVEKIPEGPVKMYYGDKAGTHSVLRLLENAKSNGIMTLPKILLVEGEHEPVILKEVRKKFQIALEAVVGGPVNVIIGKGHNHISIYTALSSGQGEEWAVEASKWMWANK